jgi:hypothetical protein
VTYLAAQIGRPRSTVSRWLSGGSECSLADLLRFVDVTTQRPVDFVAIFVDPALIPSLAGRWEEERLRRELATRLPVSQAVLRALELAEYRALPAHRPGFIATRIGISIRDEATAIEALERAAVIRWDGKRYHVEPVTLDIGQATRVADRRARAYWLERGRERLEADSEGLFSYNVMSVSSEDFERLQRMHVRYFEQVRAVVAASEPLEKVAVLGMQLFELAPDAPADS